MANHDLPSIDELRQLLICDAEAGILTWLPRPERRVECSFNGLRRATIACAKFNACWAGKPALSNMNTRGYFSGGINGRKYLAHRVIWAMARGSWPIGQIDHVNGIRGDNRISNLRIATARENSANKAKRCGTSSVFFGVTFRSDTGKWAAQIKDNGKRLHLGCFASEVDAALAADVAARRVHGAFARLNFQDI